MTDTWLYEVCTVQGNLAHPFDGRPQSEVKVGHDN